MKLIEISGDLFDSTAPALAQGVNVDGEMQSGIAPVFKRRWPAMYEDYRTLCLAGGLEPGHVHLWLQQGLTIYNIASQDRPGRSARLEWLESSLTAALVDADQQGLDRIAMPRIGCGVGGLDWADVRPIVKRLAEFHVADVELWTLPEAVR